MVADVHVAARFGAENEFAAVVRGASAGGSTASYGAGVALSGDGEGEEERGDSDEFQLGLSVSQGRRGVRQGYRGTGCGASGANRGVRLNGRLASAPGGHLVGRGVY